MDAWGYSSKDSDSTLDTWADLANGVLTKKQQEDALYDTGEALKVAKKVTSAVCKKLEAKLVKAAEKHRKLLAKSKVPRIQQAAVEWSWFVGVALLMREIGFKLSAKLKATCRSLLEDELSTFKKLNLAGWKDPKKRVSQIKKELKLLK